jgi:hypothetical protein
MKKRAGIEEGSQEDESGTEDWRVPRVESREWRVVDGLRAFLCSRQVGSPRRRIDF